jgi:MGT family glycosyltransferase
VAFDWDALDPGRRHVLITVGSLGQDMAMGFYQRIVEAVRPLRDRLQAIVVSEEPLDDAGHVLVAPRVPMLDLLPRLDAVVTHGGLNTVCEALAHGVPLVIAPIRGDQPINAARVVAAGAGIRVSFGRARPGQLRDAVASVLTDPAYRAAAQRMRGSLAAAGGATAASALLEKLAGGTDD